MNTSSANLFFDSTSYKYDSLFRYTLQSLILARDSDKRIGRNPFLSTCNGLEVGEDLPSSGRTLVMSAKSLLFTEVICYPSPRSEYINVKECCRTICKGRLVLNFFSLNRYSKPSNSI